MLREKLYESFFLFYFKKSWVALPYGELSEELQQELSVVEEKNEELESQLSDLEDKISKFESPYENDLDDWP